jgi:hypothetical protein
MFKLLLKLFYYVLRDIKLSLQMLELINHSRGS